jgi:hypothetical protein
MKALDALKHLPEEMKILEHMDKLKKMSEEDR